MGAILAALVLLIVAKAAGGSGAPAKAAPKSDNPFGDPIGSQPPKNTGVSVVSPTLPIKVTVPGFDTLDPSKVTAPEAVLPSGLDSAGYTAKIPPAPLTWPGIQSLPPMYRNPAMAAVENLRYLWVMEDEGPTAANDPCMKGSCSSDAVYAAFEPIHNDKAHIDAVYGGLGGVDASAAMNELSHAYNKLKAVGR